MVALDGLIDWSITWLVDPLLDWLIEWMFHWLIDWMFHWLIDWMFHWLIDWLVDWSHLVCRSQWTLSPQTTPETFLYWGRRFVSSSPSKSEEETCKRVRSKLNFKGIFFSTKFSNRKNFLTWNFPIFEENFFWIKIFFRIFRMWNFGIKESF